MNLIMLIIPISSDITSLSNYYILVGSVKMIHENVFTVGKPNPVSSKIKQKYK